MQKLTAPFSRLIRSRILVAGDLLLDTYTIGKTRRISPEAPVVVVNVTEEEARAGGAGNVLLNLISLGVEVIAMGRVGLDAHGEQLLHMLQEEGIVIDGLVRQPHYPTPVKNRIIAENQQIVRIDREQLIPLPEQLEQQLIEKLPALLEGVQVVALSDYGKGFLTRTLLQALIAEARRRKIPVIADPKGIDFTKYSHSTIIKPNLGEAYAAANLPADTPLEKVASAILHLSQAEQLMITRGELGISLFSKQGERRDFPVVPREVKDVTGAGDTVLAMLACALGSGLSLDEAVQLSNVAAGIAIERLGCARISLQDLARSLLEQDSFNKIFDGEHAYALQKALQGRAYNLLGLNADEGIHLPLLKAIHELKQTDSCDLVLFLTTGNLDEEFIQILSSFQEVTYLILDRELLRTLTPQAIFEMREGRQLRLQNPLELIAQIP